jgi:general L-amino acid transport system permease protein
VSGKRETVIAAVRRDWRNIALQGLLVVVLAWGVSWLVANASANLQRQNIASGFGFLQRTAGFDISQRLIAYANTDTYARAFWVGLTNTLLVAGVSMVLATVVGFALGIARLSPNWLIAKLALVYVEIVRNVPLLLWLFLIYFGVLLRLPAPEASWHIGGGGLLNQRGLYLPSLVLTSGWLAVIGLAVVGSILAVALNARGKIGLAGVMMLVAPAVLGAVLAGPLHVQSPVLGRFNVTGGLEILPELMALTIGLVTYTAAYIGEIVRAGIQSVARGQRQAASALGLTDRDALRFIVVPQALRAIVPPLTNLNHTNQAVETIAITMAVYLTLSLAIAGGMGVLNARVALKGR